MVKMLVVPYTGILVPVHTPWSILLVRLLMCLYNHTQTLTSLLHLSWFMHISITIKKAKRLLDLIYRNFYSNSSPSTLLSLYKSIVQPVLKYSSVVWDPASPSASSTLESVQLFALKIISKSWFSPTLHYSPPLKSKLSHKKEKGKNQFYSLKSPKTFLMCHILPIESVPMLDPFETSPHITLSFLSVIHLLI